MKLPISAMLVGYNEAHFLPQCFESISFCEEIIYTDLGSTDDSLLIAQKFAHQVYHRKPVPSCEMIQAEVVNYTKHDWVLFIDPDEKVDAALSTQIINDFEKITSVENTGAVMVPWQFYFRKKKLRGTVWGGINQKYLFVNKHRFLFEPVVHYGRKLKPGFIDYRIGINNKQNNVLHHYWMNNFGVFIKKHLRYLKNEGKDRFDLGMRTTLKAVLLSPANEFYRSFFTLKGYKDGFVGLTLSGFWAWYQLCATYSLYKLQQKNLQ